MRPADEVPSPEVPALGLDKHGKLRTVTGTFTAQMQVSTARLLVVTGHIYSDDTPVEINRSIDMAQDAIDRQVIRCSIAVKEEQVKAQVEAIEHFVMQLEDMRARQAPAPAGASKDAPKRPRLNSQELQALQNGERTIDNAKKQIKKLEGEIGEARKKLDHFEARA